MVSCGAINAKCSVGFDYLRYLFMAAMNGYFHARRPSKRHSLAVPFTSNSFVCYNSQDQKPVLSSTAPCLEQGMMDGLNKNQYFKDSYQQAIPWQLFEVKVFVSDKSQENNCFVFPPANVTLAECSPSSDVCDAIRHEIWSKIGAGGSTVYIEPKRPSPVNNGCGDGNKVEDKENRNERQPENGRGIK